MLETIKIAQWHQTQACGGISLYIGGHRTLPFAFSRKWLHSILRGKSLYFMVLRVLLYA